jgi:hypothetical protein
MIVQVCILFVTSLVVIVELQGRCDFSAVLVFVFLQILHFPRSSEEKAVRPPRVTEAVERQNEHLKWKEFDLFR